MKINGLCTGFHHIVFSGFVLFEILRIPSEDQEIGNRSEARHKEKYHDEEHPVSAGEVHAGDIDQRQDGKQEQEQDDGYGNDVVPLQDQRALRPRVDHLSVGLPLTRIDQVDSFDQVLHPLREIPEKPRSFNKEEDGRFRVEQSEVGHLPEPAGIFSVGSWLPRAIPERIQCRLPLSRLQEDQSPEQRYRRNPLLLRGEPSERLQGFIVIAGLELFDPG